jgi:hypothetical protein
MVASDEGEQAGYSKPACSPNKLSSTGGPQMKITETDDGKIIIELDKATTAKTFSSDRTGYYECPRNFKALGRVVKMAQVQTIFES